MYRLKLHVLKKRKKTELQTGNETGKRMSMCGRTVQLRGRGSRLDSYCNAPVLPLGVPCTKGKTGHL